MTKFPVRYYKPDLKRGRIPMAGHVKAESFEEAKKICRRNGWRMEESAAKAEARVA